MNPRRMRTLLLTFLLAMGCIILMAPIAGAVVLWDQSTLDPSGNGFFNSISGSPPFGLTIHTVDDVTVDGSWVVTSITTYYSRIDPNWGGAISQGRLHVFPKTAPLPLNGTDDPAASPTVAMSATMFNDHFEIKASGLNLVLAPGDYWIGITPIAPSGFFGPEIHLSTTTPLGDAAASYDVFGNPPVWFNMNPGVDTAVLIEGDRPVPVESTTWGATKALFRQ